MGDARVYRPRVSRLEPTWYPDDVRERIREFGMDTIMAYRTSSRKKPAWLRRDSQDSKKSVEGLFVRAEQPTAIEPARIAEKVAHPLPVYCVPDPSNESTYVCRLMALRNESPDSVKFDWDVPFAECKGPGHQQLAETLAKRVQDMYRPGVEFIAADVEHWLVHGGEQPLPVFTHQYLTQSPKKRGRPSLKGSTDGKAKVSRASIGSDVRTEILKRQGNQGGMGPATAPPAQASYLPGANGGDQSDGKKVAAKRQLFGGPSDEETETSSELSAMIANGHAPSQGEAAMSSSSSGQSTSSSSSSEDTSSSSDTDSPAATEDVASPEPTKNARDPTDGATTTESSDEESDSSSSSSEDESEGASALLARPEPEKTEQPPLSDRPAVNKDESSTESDSSSSSDDDDDDDKGASSSAGGFSDQDKEPSSLVVHAPASRENAKKQAEPTLRDASSLVACCHMAIAGLLNPDMVFGGNAWTRERVVDSLDAIKQQLLENLELYTPLE